MNQFELSYIPLCGLVDSDVYDGVVNFPFIVPALDEGTQVMIPAGSPFVQIIPVKRDEWNEEISNTVGNKSIIQHYDQLDADRYDFYRKKFMEKEKLQIRKIENSDDAFTVNWFFIFRCNYDCYYCESHDLISKIPEVDLIRGTHYLYELIKNLL